MVVAHPSMGFSQLTPHLDRNIVPFSGEIKVAVVG
jgi:hypothetical protein